jgi:hypothetical protein
MMPLPLLLGIQNAVICHCGEFRVGDVPANKELNENNWQIHGKKKVEFSFVRFSTALQ